MVSSTIKYDRGAILFEPYEEEGEIYSVPAQAPVRLKDITDTELNTEYLKLVPDLADLIMALPSDYDKVKLASLFKDFFFDKHRRGLYNNDLKYTLDIVVEMYKNKNNILSPAPSKI